MSGFLWGALGSLRANAQAAQAESAAQRGVSKAEAAVSEAKLIHDRLDRLTLVCMALWSLLQEKTDLTEDDLLKRVEEIDLLDGRLDGKVAPQVQQCPQCGRRMSVRHKRCLYCGAENLDAGAFERAL